MKLAVLASLVVSLGSGCQTEEKRPETSTLELTSVTFSVTRDGGGTVHPTPEIPPHAPPLPPAPVALPGPIQAEARSQNAVEWTSTGPRVRTAPDLLDMGMHDSKDDPGAPARTP